MSESEDAQGSEFIPSPEFLARQKRVMDAIQLKQPDRIPLILGMGYKLAEMGGITKQALYDNPDQAQELLEQAAALYQPDMIFGAWHTPEPSKALGDRMTKWPGYGLDANGSFQFNEQEFMKADDYDDFLEDPSDWAVRVYLPRAFRELEGLAMLPPWDVLIWLLQRRAKLRHADPAAGGVGVAGHGPGGSSPGRVVGPDYRLQPTDGRIGLSPMPFLAVFIEAPFDFMSDTLRGMRGIFLDMMRQPDKLLAAQEKVLRIQLKFAIAATRAIGSPYVFIPLHRGSDGFMSLKQFEKFYWPQLKEMMLQLIEAGITPWAYYEGVWDQRLPYLAELPPGKTMGSFQDSDIFKVKEIVGDTMCIMGGMPIPLLVGGTPEQVREHTQKVCQVVGKDGGFIMTSSVLELEGCNPELIKVWVEATQEYGGY